MVEVKASILDTIEARLASEENPEQEHQRHLAAMREALTFFEEWAEGQGYGCFPGGDPRRFAPDPKESTEAQRVAHRAACEAWNRGDCVQFEGSMNLNEIRYTRIDGTKRVIPARTAFVSSSVFGHGTIRWRDEEMVRARDGLRSALGCQPGGDK